MLMAKGRQASLNRPDGRPLDPVRMGIGRQPAPRPGLIGALGLRPRGDLGIFAVLYGNGRFLDGLFADNPINRDESIGHR
ncbi:hypothetical protein [Streptomyces sp. NPDC093591]|uniref:hypothetical protein n=1 Tax=Streptomyces sp. NPDC093591 TaxID=3366044 RepID=UPI0038295B4B